MIEIVATKDLKPGMFIAQLDRPWLGTPFLVQGFLLDNAEDMATLARLCQFVSVDRARSVGGEYKADAPVDVAPAFARAGRREAPLVITPVQGGGKAAAAAVTKKPLFAEILRTLNTEQEAPRPARAVPGTPATRTFDELLSHNDIELPDTFGDASLGDQWSLWRDRMSGLIKRLRPPAAAKAPAEPPLVGTRELAGTRFKVLGYANRVTVEQEILTSYDTYRETQSLISDLAEQLKSSTTLDIESVKGNVGDMVESIIRNPDALLWLSKLKHSNNHTYDHALNVSIHLMAFGRHLGLPKAELHNLGLGGLLQDIGIIRLPQELIHKQGSLTQAERKWMKKHVHYGYEMLANQLDLPRMVRNVIFKHHERIDGSGYPRQLAGLQVGLFGEIAGLVDSYCAMLYPRAYRPALDTQKALEEINAMRGHLFSESVTDEFVQSVGLYPVGTLVELNSGEVGIVVEQNRIRRLKPRLLILLGPDKSRNPTPGMLNLLNDPMVRENLPYVIVRALPQGSYGLDPGGLGL